ncbi:MAG: glycosyl hydrolase family 8 [Oscillospiraceae bacterium]|nr:glycosyl hydrolase family 8 [Oscillospiraceae bacterium]
MKNLKNTFIFISAASMLLTLTPSYAYAASSETNLSSDTISFYSKWKDKYIQKNPYSNEDEYYVLYSEETYADTKTETAVTVSEAHGYGMLITASMSDYDKNAHQIFDGMYRFYREHTSGISENLMAWQQSDNGKALINSDGDDSASDGDIDIAYSLLMADKIWGSDGDINYRQSAVDIINDIMKYEVNKTDWTIQLGDWVYGEDESSKYYSATRSSDFIMQYFPVFAEFTGDKRWLDVYDKTYEIITEFTEKYNTGLLPDFIIKDKNNNFVAAPADFLESENDGSYYYNSCRCPWRIGMDYLINKEPRALKYAESLSGFLSKSTNNNPEEIMAGYTVDGKPIEDYNDLCFLAPVLISSACTSDTDWHSAVREAIVDYDDDVYFGDTIKMICLIIDDGGWIVPSDEAVTGDVNSDGEFNIADIICLQKWLLVIDDTQNIDLKSADICEDNLINVSDLSLLKQKLFLK